MKFAQFAITLLLLAAPTSLAFGADNPGEPPKPWSKDNLKTRLTSMQYKVTQKDGTEPPFKNEFWNSKKAGIYVDIVSGEPLFSSTHKYKSGTGWPSFTQPLIASNVIEKSDISHFMVRTEVRSKHADSHLGHVFDDGPKPTGKRYCINSAALRFVPAGDLEAQGYGHFAYLFADKKAATKTPEKASEQAAKPAKTAKATFGGGCFWCMEPPFEKMKGVASAVSGYMGGEIDNPTYKAVSRGKTKHVEVVQVTYDPSQVSYRELLDTYWRAMDPTDGGGQFADRGRQYRPVIFAHTDKQRKIAEASKAALAKSGRFSKPIVVPIEDAREFWRAEEYHQDYYKKNPAHYKAYSRGSGRVGFLQRIWGDS